VLSGRGLCDELITCPEESYWLCCVVCDLETSRMGAPYIHDISRLRVKTLYGANQNKQTKIGKWRTGKVWYEILVKSELQWLSRDVNIWRQQTKWKLTFSCSFGKRFIDLLKHGLAWLFKRWHKKTGEEILTYMLHSWLKGTYSWVTQHLHHGLNKRKQYT